MGKRKKPSLSLVQKGNDGDPAQTAEAPLPSSAALEEKAPSPPQVSPQPPQEEKKRDWVARTTRPIWFVFTSLLSLVGGTLGVRFALWYVSFVQERFFPGPENQMEPTYYWLSLIAFTTVGILLGFLFASLFFRQLLSFFSKIEAMPLEDRLAGFLGLFVGLGVAYLLSPLMENFRYVGTLLVWALYAVFAFLGPLITLNMKREIMTMLHLPVGVSQWQRLSSIKLLDTNVIIDGRIAEICKAGFLEGTILVPEFVIEELQTIADSEDELRRNRGRRGLDVLQEMRNLPNVHLHVLRDYGIPLRRTDPTDVKLRQLAHHLGAAIITNDYNLGKLASLENVPVLNVNVLACALKPIVLPGEELRVKVIREGREPNQGVGYLADGTMVVVENGRSFIGQEINIEVGSVLQTIMGKMIFGTPKGR